MLIEDKTDKIKALITDGHTYAYIEAVLGVTKSDIRAVRFGTKSLSRPKKLASQKLAELKKEEIIMMYLNGTSKEVIKAVTGVSSYYVIQFIAALDRKLELTSTAKENADRIRKAEERLIQMAVDLSNGKGDLDEYKRRLHNFSKAEANEYYIYL